MRTIDNYMHKTDGRKVSGSQRLAILDWEKMSADLDRMREQKRILQQCGLDREAKRLQEQINAKEQERRAYEDKLNEERREMVRGIRLALCACDFATICADEFGETTHRLSRGLYGRDNDFCEDIRKCANEFNKVVQMIDTGGNIKAAMYYAELAEIANERMKAVAKDVIKEWMEKGKGKQYF